MQVLYVEDEPDIRELTCLVLRDANAHDVLDFSSGSEALSQVDALGGIDLLLLDVMMPEMDGRTLLKELRAKPATAEVPVIFMTAKTMPAEVAELRRLGAVHVISKPFDVVTVREEIEAAVSRHA